MTMRPYKGLLLPGSVDDPPGGVERGNSQLSQYSGLTPDEMLVPLVAA